MLHAAIVFAIVVVALLLLTVVLFALPRLGGAGRAVAAMCTRAPLLDVIVALYTLAPPIAGAIVGLPAESVTVGRLAGAGTAILGQSAALLLWSALHRSASSKTDHIHSTLSSIVGPLGNHLALWCTLVVVPVFWGIRLGEIVAYPPLTWLARLPKYRHRDWVNVSRQKFSGLVGYDLVWCLYCDWMTGVWSLGGEMLRNVESFWCPIRFSNTAKCANCRVDFPDVDHDWIPPDGTLSDVTQLLRDRYPGPSGENAWFGHPARLTVDGAPPSGADRPSD